MTYMIIKTWYADNEDEILGSLYLVDVDEVLHHRVGKRGEYSNTFKRKILGMVKEGDNLIFESISKIANSHRELIDMINELINLKVDFHDIDSGLEIVHGNYSYQLIIEEYQRMSKLYRAVTANSIRRGQLVSRGGRPKGAKGKKRIDSYRVQILELLNAKVTKKEICENFGLSRPTLNDALKRWGD